MEGEDEIALAPMLEKKVCIFSVGTEGGGGRKKEPTNTDRGRGGERKSVAFKRHISFSLWPPLLAISITAAKSHRKRGEGEESGGLLPLHKTNGQNPLSPKPTVRLVGGASKSKSTLAFLRNISPFFSPAGVSLYPA